MPAVDWPRARLRYEAWWQGELLDRPLIQLTAPSRPDALEPAPQDETELLEWFTDPGRVILRLEGELACTYYVGDAFPVAFPVSGNLAAIEAAYLGCPYRVQPLSNTAWASPIIDDWDRRLPLRVQDDNWWWQRSQLLLETGARRAAGRYTVGIPDLQGGGEILALLRGTDRLAVDLVDDPRYILTAVDEVNQAWLYYYNRCFEIIHRHQEGWVDWLGVWSDRPAVTVECDFNAMISPRMFNRYFLPAVEQQCAWIGRTIFHLDGPGALPHLEALLGVRSLSGIQWVPGAGKPPMSEWVPLLRRIQAAGKLLVLGCEPWEAERLLRELRPEGVLLQVVCASPGEADALLGKVEGIFPSGA